MSYDINLLFWNIEKKNKLGAAPKSQALNDAMFVVQTLMNKYARWKLDMVVLAEVVKARGEGQGFVQTVVNMMNVHAQQYFSGPKQPRFEGRFEWSPNRAGHVGSCNFGMIWNAASPVFNGAGGRIEFYWEPDFVRPIMILQTNEVNIAAIHAKASLYAHQRERAETEIRESCIYLMRKGLPAVLIGDMNVPFDSVSPDTTRELSNLKWQKIGPGFEPTHVGRNPDRHGRTHQSVLDYIWRYAGVTLCEAEATRIPYNDWQTVDHAPIMYRIADRYPAPIHH